MAAKRRRGSASTGSGTMNLIAYDQRRARRSRAPTVAATILAEVTGTIFLAFPVNRELWCRPRGYEPKVLNRIVGSCLPRSCDFARKTRHRNRARTAQR